ncbi:MAG: histidine kinase dimerization/phospho-acceptor domain-containing protein, partial [Patescibacteria group bacterium]|nr:histidine kinase dimerization/phospho-acceptor domain-containing protein [Patescibacteria group bacterium]
MQRSPVARFAVLGLAWTALAIWQWCDYDAECRHARETLIRQAESIVQALTGGIRSHRRLGYYFADQLEGVLEELAGTKDVLAAVVASEDGRLVCSAGADHGLPPTMRTDVEIAWRDGALHYVQRFELPPRSEEPPGHGRGLGRGRGPRRMQDAGGEEAAPFAEGGVFVALLVLDGAPVAERCRRAAWTRMTVVAAGALVLFFLAVVWRATFRLAEARAREQLLETETRHLRELGQAAAGLAHETRNPLGLIRGWTQRLASPNSDVEEPAARAQAIIEECDRLTARINQFLAFARPAEPRLEDVPMQPLADELTALLEPDLQGKRVRLDDTLLGQGTTVRADRELL